MSTFDTLLNGNYVNQLNWHSKLCDNGTCFLELESMLDNAIVQLFLVDNITKQKIYQIVLDSKDTALDRTNVNTTFNMKAVTIEDSTTYPEDNIYFRTTSYFSRYLMADSAVNGLSPVTQDKIISGMNLQTAELYHGVTKEMINNPNYCTSLDTDKILLQIFPLGLQIPRTSQSQWPLYRGEDQYLHSGVDTYVKNRCIRNEIDCKTCLQSRDLNHCMDMCQSDPYCWGYTNSPTYGMFLLDKTSSKINNTDSWNLTSVTVPYHTNTVLMKYIHVDSNMNVYFSNESSEYSILVDVIDPNQSNLDLINILIDMISKKTMYRCCDPNIDSTTEFAKTCDIINFSAKNNKFNPKCESAMLNYCKNPIAGACRNFCNYGLDLDNNPINCDSIMTKFCNNSNSFIDETCSCFLPSSTVSKYFDKLSEVPGSMLYRKVECEYIPCTQGSQNVIKRNSMRKGTNVCPNVNICINSENIKNAGDISATNLNINQYIDCINKNYPSTPAPTPSTPAPTPSTPAPTPPSPTPSVKPSLINDFGNTLLSVGLFKKLLYFKSKSSTMSDTKFIMIAVPVFFIMILIILSCILIVIIAVSK